MRKHGGNLSPRAPSSRTQTASHAALQPSASTHRGDATAVGQRRLGQALPENISIGSKAAARTLSSPTVLSPAARILLSPPRAPSPTIQVEAAGSPGSVHATHDGGGLAAKRERGRKRRRKSAAKEVTSRSASSHAGAGLHGVATGARVTTHPSRHCGETSHLML